MSREDFNKLTKSIIASRSGYRCSFPGCNKTLIGPGKMNNEIISIGECAHIYSAEKYGPRGNGSLTAEQIKSPENGIFLCRNHHKIIDANDGNKYSADILSEFKGRHESMISREIGDYPLTVNWISSISIESSDFFINKLKIRLGKVTHIYGDNMAGKTAVCDLFYEIISRKILHERIKEKNTIDLIIQSDNEHKITCVRSNNSIDYYDNNEHLPILPFSIEIIYLRKVYRSLQDQVEAIARCYGVEIDLILCILKDEYFKNTWVKKIEVIIKRDKPYLTREIHIDNGHGLFLNLERCSGFEIGNFIVEVGLILSKYLSRRSTVLFIVEWGNISCFDDKNMTNLLERLQSHENVFQSIIVSPDKMSKLEWIGWEIARFTNHAPETKIDQENFA